MRGGASWQRYCSFVWNTPILGIAGTAPVVMVAREWTRSAAGVVPALSSHWEKSSMGVKWRRRPRPCRPPRKRCRGGGGRAWGGLPPALAREKAAGGPEPPQRSRTRKGGGLWMRCPVLVGWLSGAGRCAGQGAGGSRMLS